MDIQYLKTVLLAAAHLNFSKVAEEIPCAPILCVQAGKMCGRHSGHHSL